MRFEPPLVLGTLIKRYKRFLADVTLADGTAITAHVPNTGSMASSSAPGSKVALSCHDKPGRKLPYTLELVEANGGWVGVNTARPNHVVEEAIRAGRVSQLSGYFEVRREIKYGEASRIDLLLSNEAARCYVEVKNVTYRVDGQARFPDAVTERGARHLVELREQVRLGHRAVMFFLVNRQDCSSFSIAREIDPAYGRIFDEVSAQGVEVLVYQCRNSLSEQSIDQPLPLR